MSGTNAYTGRAQSAGPLFDSLRPVSRGTDPSTSKIAEAKLRASNRLNEGCRKTLAALREYIARHNENPTSAEMAGGDASLRHLYAKRLADIRSLGLVKNGPQRVCKTTGQTSLTWGLV